MNANEFANDCNGGVIKHSDCQGIFFSMLNMTFFGLEELSKELLWALKEYTFYLGDLSGKQEGTGSKHALGILRLKKVFDKIQIEKAIEFVFES
ncbi:MAG: hypothetical protein PF541_05950 [Prolixibacteraceae bacterium]|nr:hypothetical protein [Prolixibacteraceae bacterium]